MTSSARIPGLARATVIEWRARRIADPLGRLRYLREITESRGQSPTPWMQFAAGLALLLIPLVPGREAMLIPAAVKLQVSPPPIWAVESTQDHDTYSNGLRVENAYVSGTHGRSYAVFPVGSLEPAVLVRRTDPAGIVYHATESDLAPLEAEQNAHLLRIDEALLDYVRRRHAYHFVIDRFGRVYRVVPESDVANHAGNSVWAVSEALYLNLNAAFLGVAFEARSGSDTGVGPAQLRAGRALTDMLRSRFRIPPENCVTHAQVSVNPRNMQIGYHTDWAARFPFDAMGLPDNYGLPVASVLMFGFGYDEAFLQAAGGRPWKGLASAEETLQERAAASGISSAEYARRLRKDYRGKMEALHFGSPLEEINHE